MVNVIDHGMNVQMTTDAARFTHSQSSNILSLEHDLFSLWEDRQRPKGRGAFREWRPGGWLSGDSFHPRPSLPLPQTTPESISEDHPVNGIYRAGSDHRKDGQQLAGSVLVSGQIKRFIEFGDAAWR